jgi:hypothetical protein
MNKVDKTNLKTCEGVTSGNPEYTADDSGGRTKADLPSICPNTKQTANYIS